MIFTLQMICTDESSLALLMVFTLQMIFTMTIYTGNFGTLEHREWWSLGGREHGILELGIPELGYWNIGSGGVFEELLENDDIYR
jgi:hypothetical protein